MAAATMKRRAGFVRQEGGEQGVGPPGPPLEVPQAGSQVPGLGRSPSRTGRRYRTSKRHTRSRSEFGHSRRRLAGRAQTPAPQLARAAGRPARRPRAVAARARRRAAGRLRHRHLPAAPPGSGGRQPAFVQTSLAGHQPVAQAVPAALRDHVAVGHQPGQGHPGRALADPEQFAWCARGTAPGRGAGGCRAARTG